MKLLTLTLFKLFFIGTLLYFSVLNKKNLLDLTSTRNDTRKKINLNLIRYTTRADGAKSIIYK